MCSAHCNFKGRKEPFGVNRTVRSERINGIAEQKLSTGVGELSKHLAAKDTGRTRCCGTHEAFQKREYVKC